MSKIGLWKNIFGYREKVAVKIGAKTEMLTDTQSIRFGEINEARAARPRAPYRNPLEDSYYRLEDAAFRLMITEEEVLARASAGGLHLFVDVTGMSGYWCRLDANGDVSRSPVATIRSGWLKLRSRACNDIEKHGRTIVRTLDLRTTEGTPNAGIDDNTLAVLRAWGPGEKQFFPLHPLTVERDMVVLLPPLLRES